MHQIVFTVLLTAAVTLLLTGAALARSEHRRCDGDPNFDWLMTICVGFAVLIISAVFMLGRTLA